MQTREQKTVDITELLNIACQAAITAGNAIMKVYNSKTENIAAVKSFPTTVADKISHKILENALCKTGLPVLSEEGEHIDYHARKHWSYFWLIDPLDGTTEFLKKNGEFTVNIALVKQNKPIAGVMYVPCTRVLYFGLVGAGMFKSSDGHVQKLRPVLQRRNMQELVPKENLRIIVSRSHFSKETKAFLRQFIKPTIMFRGSALKFIALLENEADLYPRLSTTMEWDTAAGHALLNAAGKALYQVDGKTELVYNKPNLENPSFLAL